MKQANLFTNSVSLKKKAFKSITVEQGNCSEGFSLSQIIPQIVASRLRWLGKH
jgi:hypothetical protein